MWGRIRSAGAGNDRYERRRRDRHVRGASLVVALLILLSGAVIYGLHEEGVRISRIQLYGGDQALAEDVQRVMNGKYFWLIPRDSTFFFPARRIRTALLEAYPHIKAVSFFRDGLTGLTVRITDRSAVARWCGRSPTSGADEYCYLFDDSGYLFAAAEATTTAPIYPFKVYVPLVRDPEEPLRATLTQADVLPSAFDFARQVGTLGSAVSMIVVRGDDGDAPGSGEAEVDHVLQSGTRITYVLGRTEEAYTALVSARENLTLSDGSIEYVDVRFPGKIYVKKVDSE